MKNIAIGIFSVVVMMLLILIIMTTNGRTTRKTELENALNNAAEIAMEMIAAGDDYSPQSNDELFADFAQAFFMQINSVSDVELVPLALDYKKGLLDVEAISHYTHLNGSKGSVSVRKTIILEVYQEEVAKQTFTITFLVNGAKYRVYTIYYGDTCPVPPTPILDEGLTFIGWKDFLGELNYSESELASIIPESDMELWAIIEKK